MFYSETYLDTINYLEAALGIELSDITGAQPTLLIKSRFSVLFVCMHVNG